MGFHDDAAQVAVERGLAATDFHAAARKHAAISWAFAIGGALAGLYYHWLAGALLGVGAAYSAMKSISSTKIAARLERRA